MIVFSTKNHQKVSYLKSVGEKILSILGKPTHAQINNNERVCKEGIFQVHEINHALDCLNSYPDIILEDENEALPSCDANIYESNNSDVIVKFRTRVFPLIELFKNAQFNQEPVIWQSN